MLYLMTARLPTGFLIKVSLLGLVVLSASLFLYPARVIQAQSCPTSFGTDQTIVSNAGLLTLANPADSGTFNVSATDKCIIGSGASIPKPFDTYSQIKSIYFDKNKFAGTKTTLVGNQTHRNPGGPPVLNFNDNAGTMYNVQGNLTIDASTSPVNFPGGKTGVVFVDGDLTIDQNIIYGTANTGIVFVVGGKINILESVTEVDAYMIDFGRFCSGWLGAADTTCSGDAGAENQLVVKGSLISLDPDPANAPKFVRQSTNPRTDPAELFQYQSKYLVIIRNIFSADRIIWHEID